MFREFNGKKYPVPGMDTAMEVLRPGARYSSENLELLEWEDDEGREPPTKEELNAEFQREVEIYNYYLYERNREEQYPELTSQLDMLYHDIKDGNLTNGRWISAIEEVKNNNPKPNYPEP